MNVAVKACCVEYRIRNLRALLCYVTIQLLQHTTLQLRNTVQYSRYLILKYAYFFAPYVSNESTRVALQEIDTSIRVPA